MRVQKNAETHSDCNLIRYQTLHLKECLMMKLLVIMHFTAKGSRIYVYSDSRELCCSDLHHLIGYVGPCCREGALNVVLAASLMKIQHGVNVWRIPLMKVGKSKSLNFKVHRLV